MNRNPFNQAINTELHTRPIGAGLCIKKGKRAASSELAQDMAQFLASGGEVEQCESAEVRPSVNPVFDPGDFGDWRG